MNRIGIDIRPLLEPRRAGVPTYAAAMIRALVARADIRYALFLNSFGRPIPADIPPESPVVEHCFSRLPNRLLNAGFRIGLPSVERFTGRLDALWLPNLNFISTKAPLVVTVHDLSFERYPRFFTAKQRLWHSTLGVRSLLKRAARVAAVSEHTKADVCESFGVPVERVVVVPPGIDARFAPQSEEEKSRVRQAYGLHAPFFLFLGTIEPRKNVERLIAAYDACHSDADLVIAGGRGWLYERVMNRAARSPKRNRIKFLDYVIDADKPALYSAASAFIYPSFYEGFGIPPAEAMACGTPVIASRDSALGETVADAGLLVDPYDEGEIARAMDAVLEDTTLNARLRAAGLERAKLFTWGGSAAVLAKTFGEI